MSNFRDNHCDNQLERNFGKSIKLPQLPLLDFSKYKECDDVKIVIHNSTHKFATDAEPSGIDHMKQPIFGSIVYINGKKHFETSFGFPTVRFPKGSCPKLRYKNKTKFTFNIHYHGLNTTGSVDGTSMETVFGHSTKLGPNVTFKFPEITNNQSLLWFHSHNMFTSMELIYGGLVGLLEIVDKPTKWLSDDFKYGDNHLLLTALDMDLTEKGTQTFSNLVTDENRSCFGTINGVSTVNWYSSKENAKFVNKMYHVSSRNLVKIDMLNASLNWRVFHIGVCDGDMNIQPFHLVQTDSGLMNPKELKMAFVPVASRIGIIVDLNKFKNKTAYLFFYNYDLTEIVETELTFPDQPNNPSLTATVPDLDKSVNPTPYPTPIPDPDEQNQQQNYTNLNYPIVNLIEQTEQVLDNGSIKVPEKFTIKPFLKLNLDECDKHMHKLSLDRTLSQIRKTVFGSCTYDEWKHIIKQPDFEYNKKFNYLSFLNKDYFYNLPKLDSNVPFRNFLLFPETDTNAVCDENPYGTTEFVDGANRIMVDLWNSAELNVEWAMEQYNKNPNNYKPPTLPTSKFRIYKTNDKYSNTAMISNDTLKIQFFEDEVAYGDLTKEPLANVTVVFPPTPSCNELNIQEWINLINETFEQTNVTINNTTVKLSDILSCDWSFFPYAFDFMYQKTLYIKSAVIKTNNSSNYWIRFLGRWPLLQFFGKPMTGDTLDVSASLLSQLRAKQKVRYQKMPNKINKIKSHTKNIRLNPIKANSLYTKCDEVGIFGIYDAEIQQIFPYYATSDGSVQLPIACMKRDAELILSPQNTYVGLYDGYLNDNLNSFSVKLHSNEVWRYNNGDCTDSHPLHFHLTSGYAPTTDHNSHHDRLYDQLTYSRDIFQVGPQETMSFNLTWPSYSSDEKTSSPNVRCVGGVIHCHFLQHNDSNSMIIQYFVDKD